MTPRRSPEGSVVEIETALPVAHFHVYLLVTGAAETHQVISCMGAAATDRYDVMNFIHQGCPSFSKAALAERVGSSVAVTDTFPSATVLLVHVRAAGVTIVAGVFLLLMFGAVLFSFLSKLRAAGKGTGPLRFPWHRFPPFRA